MENINKVGGIERVINILSNYFYNEFKYDIEIVSIFTQKDDLFFNFSKGIKITHYGETYKWFNKRKDESRYYNNILRDILTNHKFDIVMTFYTHISKAVIKNIKYIKNSKIIVTEHIDYYESSLKGRIYRNYLYRKADRVVVLTDEYNRLYSRFLKNVITIPNPISFKVKEKSDLHQKNIIAIGRLEKVKNFDLLIDIFRQLESKYKEWNLIIVGEGTEKNNLITQIKENNLEDRVILKCFTNNVEYELLNASIYAMTSKHEGFGLVLIEARECGLPCVSFDIIPSQEIISDEIDGLLVKRWNTDEYIEKLSVLMDSYEKRFYLGQNAVKNNNKYQIEQISFKWKKLFEEVINL